MRINQQNRSFVCLIMVLLSISEATNNATASLGMRLEYLILTHDFLPFSSMKDGPGVWSLSQIPSNQYNHGDELAGDADH